MCLSRCVSVSAFVLVRVSMCVYHICTGILCVYAHVRVCDMNIVTKRLFIVLPYCVIVQLKNPPYPTLYSALLTVHRVYSNLNFLT